jgi:transposase-like protein
MAKVSTLRTVLDRYGTEQACVDRLTLVLWPTGVTCRKCGNRRCPAFDVPGASGKPRHLHQCSKCRTQFSVTTGTVFHHSHISLRNWFLGVYFMAVSKDRMPATQLERILGVSYETAFSMKERRMAATEPDKALLAKLLEPI